MGSDAPSLAQPDAATLARWREVAEAFELPGRWISSRPYGSGWINETLLVECEAGGSRTRWIQQRINAQVFREPAQVMENVARVTAHQRAVLLREGTPDADRRALRLVPARDGGSAFVDADGAFWRTFHFIEGASSRDAVGGVREAGAAAEAFGRFLAQLADLPGPRLHETIPRFHDARARFEQVIAAAQRGRTRSPVRVPRRVRVPARPRVAGRAQRSTARERCPSASPTTTPRSTTC